MLAYMVPTYGPLTSPQVFENCSGKRSLGPSLWAIHGMAAWTWAGYASVVLWSGCPSYDMSHLLDILQSSLLKLVPSGVLTTTEDPLKWGSSIWQPLLALRSLEHFPLVNRKLAKCLKQTCSEWEWAIGTYLWSVWVARMKEVHNGGYLYIPYNHRASLLSAITLDPSLRST